MTKNIQTSAYFLSEVGISQMQSMYFPTRINTLYQ